MGTGLLCGEECSGTRQRGRLYNTVNVLNVTKLFTLKGLILWYVISPQ